MTADVAAPDAESVQQSEPVIPVEMRGKEERQAFHLVPVERTTEELYSSGLDQQEIDAFIEANINEINGDIEKHDKKRPKMGANIAAYKAAKDKWQAVSDDLAARLDYYKRLQEHIKEITASETAEDINAPVTENEQQPVSMENAAAQGEESTPGVESSTSVPESQISNETEINGNQSVDNNEPVARLTNEVSKESVQLSDEVDENGHPFVVSAEGTTSFGEIREESGLPAAPIKLSEGYQDEYGKGYGLIHIEANHGEQIRNAGFASVEEFVSFVAKNYDEDNIRVGKRRDHTGSTTYLIQVTDEHDNTLFIELSRDGSYWNVNSGGIFRKGYSNKKETVVKTEPQQPNNAVSTGSSLSAEVKSGISTAEPNGEPTVSNNESTTQSANEQENSVKSGENTQNGGEKDAIDEMREQNRIAEEREQRAGIPPRPSDYSKALTDGDAAAQKAWEKKFDDFLGRLTSDDVPAIGVTINNMQGLKSGIKAGNPTGYKENSAYKAYDYIEKALKRRKRELEQSSTNEEKSQESEDNSTTGGEQQAVSERQNNETVSQQGEQRSEQDNAPVVGDSGSTRRLNGAVDMDTMLPAMSDAEFAALLQNGDIDSIGAYLDEINDALRIGDNAPLDGMDAVRADFRKAVEQYGGEENIPAEVINALDERMKPYAVLMSTLFDRKSALQDRLRELRQIQEQAEKDRETAARAEHKATAYNGFLANKTGPGAANAEKALSKRYRFGDEGALTVAEFVEKHAQDGTLQPSTSETPKYKEKSRRAWNRMDASQQAAEEERIKNGGTKTVYYVNGYELGKTAYDYARFMQERFGSSNEAGIETEPQTDLQTKPDIEINDETRADKELAKAENVWERMSAQERMDFATENPITIEEVEKSSTDDVNKYNAIAYIRGTNNIITQLSYLKVYEDVRIRPTNVAPINGGRGSTQLAETDNRSDADRGTGGESGDVSLSTGEDSGREVASNTDGRANSTRESDLLSGEESNREISGRESTMVGVSADGRDFGGGGTDGRNGGNGRRGRRTDGVGNTGTDADRTVTSDVSIDDELNAALEDFKKTLSDFARAGRETLNLNIAGLNNKQLELLPQLINSGTRVGYALLKKGFLRLNEWIRSMKSYIGMQLRNAGLSDAEVDAFITELWNSNFPIGDEVHTIAEWASIIGMEETRKAVRTSIVDKKAAQDAAEGIEVKVGDMKNIAESLPFLLPQQQEDVLKAETQFFDESHNDREHAYGKGYMFTNGTGTGKTYTGLGIVKRFIKQGKKRILIVTPSQQKVSDWINDAKNLNIELRSLDDFAKEQKTTATQTAGEGAIITTYANFRENRALLEDVFDLVVYDESHRLLENKQGVATQGARQHYMVTNRNEDDAFLRLREVNPLYKTLLRVQEDFIKVHNETRKNNPQKNVPLLSKPLDEEYKKAYPELYRAKSAFNKAESVWVKEQQKLQEQAKQDAKATKVVFLSATPFNTRDNLDYAEQYIFSYPEEDMNTVGLYKHQSPRTRFYLEHFGGAYKFRYGRLENAPQNADVVARQEIAFSDYLQKQLNTMSGRVIDSEYDYSRDFPTVSLEIGERINSALGSITEDEVLRPLWSARHKVWFNYNYSSALFETMKTSAMIPRLKQHLECGRKVVIFHRRVETKEPIIPPFKLMMDIAERELKDIQKDDERKKLFDAIRKFKREYADLFEWEQTLDYRMPREQLADVFGRDNILFFSGKESAKVKNESVKQFNDDNSGKNIIVIQESSGKEGISLHDRTGAHQRVIITLALPQSPITALQIEGRIYRIGNKSNAIFEYPILGLNSEIVLFGQNFNKSVSTTENLALGSQARNLRDSFARGIEERSGDIPVGEQGVGGKEADAADVTVQDPFDNAVLDYYTNQKITARRDNREGKDYYPTPEPLGFMMNQWGRIKEGDEILEPSAGHGAIARYAPTENRLTAIEPSQSLFARLQIKAGSASGRDFVNDIFENYNIINKHDVVLMNPPFGVQGKLAAEHVAKAYKHLSEGGRIVAIVPEGNAQKRIGEWLDEQKDAAVVGEVLLPDVTFVQAGTSIRCRVLVIDKISNETKRNNAAAQKVTHNLDYVDTVEDFFEALRGIGMPDRTIDTKLIMQKKAKRYVGDLRSIKGVNEVLVEDGNIIIHSKGWRRFAISWGDFSGDALKQLLANQYKGFAKKIPYADETSQEIMRESQSIICKLANMTEDEMERYINNRDENNDDLRFRMAGKQKKSSFSDRSGVIPGNSSSKRLLQAGNGHLSTNSLTSQEDVAKLVKNTQNTIRSANKKMNEGGLNNLRTVENAVRKVSETLKLIKAKSTQSFYGDLYEGDFVVGGETLHLRISTHPAIGERMGNHPADDKISIVIYKNGAHISHEEHDGYTEYTYYPEEVSLEDASNAIIKGVLNLVNKGEFVDETGKAHRQDYPFVNEEDDDIRYRDWYGGNGGYVGYSMSKRAAEAREEGRYPKTDFKKEYNMPQRTLDALVDAGVIDNSEWHHTSKYGNRTTFYGWVLDEYADIYAENKKEIDALAKEVNDNIAELEKEEQAFRDSWKGYQYPETFDWSAYSRRGRQLEELPVDERMAILRSEFPETAEAEKHDNRQREFSSKIFDKKSEQRKRIEDLFEKKQSEAAERVDAEITGAVNNLAAKLNTDVEIVHDVSALPDARKRGSKGWYERGKVYVVLENADSVQDAVETVLHEVVGHKGLRALFGEEFNAMLDDVFRGASKAVRSAIIERALPLMGRGRGNAIRVATEEYMAEQAERGFDDYSLWDKVKGWFRNLLRSMGLDVEIGDNEIPLIRNSLLWLQN